LIIINILHSCCQWLSMIISSDLTENYCTWDWLQEGNINHSINHVIRVTSIIGWSVRECIVTCLYYQPRDCFSGVRSIEVGPFLDLNGKRVRCHIFNSNSTRVSTIKGKYTHNNNRISVRVSKGNCLKIVVKISNLSKFDLRFTIYINRSRLSEWIVIKSSISYIFSGVGYFFISRAFLFKPDDNLLIRLRSCPQCSTISTIGGLLGSKEVSIIWFICRDWDSMIILVYNSTSCAYMTASVRALRNGNPANLFGTWYTLFFFCLSFYLESIVIHSLHSCNHWSTVIIGCDLTEYNWRWDCIHEFNPLETIADTICDTGIIAWSIGEGIVTCFYNHPRDCLSCVWTI
jgi:hypothetical protein